MADFDLKFPGLIEIANQVNQAVCRPLAESVASRAKSGVHAVSGGYADGIHVEVEPRTSKDDFAHSRVVASAPHSMVVEARTGNLARALR